MPALFELTPQLEVIVDFTVEHDPHSPVLVVNRLLAGRQVDNAQPPHAYADATGYVNAFVVRPAVRECLAHPSYVFNIGLVAAVRTNDAGYSTHD